MNDYISEIDGGLCAVNNVEASGARKGKYGVSIIVSKGSTASGVFTSNKVTAASVKYTQKVLENEIVSAVVANSGNANCFTGEQGLKDCESLVGFVSEKLGINKKEIAIASTGVIGRQMPMDIITDVASESISKLEHSAKSSHDCAEAIMTTDTVPKECAVEVTLENGEKVKIAGICKGSGMIAPNMGTMLCFIVTDAVISSEYINKSLKSAVNDSFNMVVVDGDESTNDTALLMANGDSGVEVVKDNRVNNRFQEGLNHVCMYLAKIMARDGEGATKFMEAQVTGALTDEDARAAAKSIISSTLFKSALFGGDPNWGRIVSAVGYSGCEMNQDTITISLKNADKFIDLVKNGEILAFDDTVNLKVAEEIMLDKDIIILVDLALGDSSAVAWGCDLTYDYVKINAEYTT